MATSGPRQRLLPLIVQHPDGVSRDVLAKALPDVAPRTIQYWLSALEADALITITGEARATLYSPTTAGVALVPSASAAATLSADGTTPLPSASAVTPPSVASPPPAEATKPPTFEQLFEANLYQIIICKLPRSAVVSQLQLGPMQELRTIGERDAFLTYARDRLDALTPEEAASFGIDAAHYDAWRTNYFGLPKSPLAVESPSELEPVEEPEGDQEEDDATPEEAPRESPTHRRRHASTGQSTRSTKSADVAETLLSDATSDTPLSGRSKNAFMKELMQLLGFTDASPAVRLLLGSAVMMMVAGLFQFAARYPWLWFAVPIVMAAGLLILQQIKRRAARRIADADVAPRAPRKVTYLITIGAVLLVVGAIGGVWYYSRPQWPSESDVKDQMTTTLAPLPARVVELELGQVTTGKVGCRLTFQARIETTEPLYRRLNTDDYLRGLAPVEMARIEAAAKLLRGPDGDRFRVAAGTPPSVAGIQDIVLIAVQTPAGTVAMTNGMLSAWRSDGKWKVSIEQSTFDRSRFPGEPKPTAPATFVVDQPAEAARLKVLLTELSGYAAKVEAAAAAAAAVRENKPDPGRAGTLPPSSRDTEPVERALPASPERAHPTAAASAANPAPAPQPKTQNAEPKTEAPAKAAPLFGSADVEQVILRSLKNFAAQPGAYVFHEGGWVPLPKNNGRAVQTLARSLTSKLDALKRAEDKLLAPKSADSSNKEGAVSATPVAQLAFDGRIRVPTAGVTNLTLLFIGELRPLSEDILKRYPELKTYPLIELAPLKTLSNGTRVAPLVEIAPKLIAFGASRVEAMIETPTEGFTLLRCNGTLVPGRYALCAGSECFEVNVE